MTLEKLLIFGLALSVVTAFATWSSSTGDKRQVQKNSYVDGVNALTEKAK